MERNELISYIRSVSLVIVIGVLFFFPILFLTNTPESFIFPKQLLVVFSTLILLVLWAIQTLIDRRIQFRTNPLNLPIVLFAVIILVSAILSRNMFDSLLLTIPVVLSAVLYFVLIHTLSDRKAFSIALSALTLGGVASAILTILYYFKIYVLPFPQIQNQSFSPLGSPVQHIGYLLPLFLLSIYYIAQRRKAGQVKNDNSFFIAVGTAIVMAAGLLVIALQITNATQKPVLLPFDHGYQIALGALRGDDGRAFASLPFGSGYGTFFTDFARYRLPSFNTEENLWNLTFFYSSSYILELIATTGVLGLLSFLFLGYKFLKLRTRPLNPLFVGGLVLLALALLIPFSFSLVFLLFVLLAFYVAYLHIEEDKRVDQLQVGFTLKGNSIPQPFVTESQNRRDGGAALPSLFLVLVVIAGLFVTFWVFKRGENPRAGYYQLLRADMKFARSLTRESLNNGQQTYDLQRQAIAQFPYKSDYYRVFSQVNFALAQSLSGSIPRNSSPSAQVQQTMIQLLQQSINNGRAAISVSPLSAVNWQNLSNIYRNLFNVGENAEQFSVASMNQSIALDPVNPVLRIQLGGIYYQLQQFQLAQQQFEIAVRLKQNYANAWYNLGKAYEAQGSYAEALVAFQNTAQLVRNNKESSDLIAKDIENVRGKVDQAKEPGNLAPSNDNNLELATPSATFPDQEPELDLPEPPSNSVRVSPSPTPPSSSPTPAREQ